MCLQDVDGVEIVKQIALHLQQMKEVDRVYAITGAKVPIVKFVWTKRGIEGEWVQSTIEPSVLSITFHLFNVELNNLVKMDTF